MSDKQRYPLSWPDGWKRTTSRSNAQFGKVAAYGDPAPGDVAPRHAKKRLSIEDAFDRLERELRLFGVHADAVIVSTNLKLTLRGIPAGNQGEPSDPGVAVYWTRKGKSECMAIDNYRRVADNLAAIAASLGAMRAIERHGGAQILDRAFLGFAQLPQHAGRRPWRQVFELHPDVDPTPELLERRFRERAAQLHPDKVDGDHERMVELNIAREDARRELGA